MIRQRYFWGGVITAVATNVIGGALGGGGNGKGQAQLQQRAGKTLAQSFMEGAMSPQARQSRGSEIANVTARGKAKNQQIIDVVQRELELAYRDPAAAAHRIFKDYV